MSVRHVAVTVALVLVSAVFIVGFLGRSFFGCLERESSESGAGSGAKRAPVEKPIDGFSEGLAGLGDIENAVSVLSEAPAQTELGQKSSAVSYLVENGSQSIPALKEALLDPRANLYAVDALVRIGGTEAIDALHATLVELLERDPEAILGGSGGGWKKRMLVKNLAAGLGRLKSLRSVDLLEELNKNAVDSHVAGPAGWALEQITGDEYERSYDPWD